MADGNSEATQEVADGQDGGQTEAVSTEQETVAPANDTVTRRDFQQMQSVLDKQVAEREKENKLLRQQLKEMQLNAAPEEQRAAIEMQQELEANRAELAKYQRENALRQLSQEYDVPFDILSNAQTPEEAWGIALTSMREKLLSGQATQSAPTQPPTQPQATTPFVTPQQAGGGSKERDYDAEINAAQNEGRVVDYIRLLREKEATGS